MEKDEIKGKNEEDSWGEIIKVKEKDPPPPLSGLSSGESMRLMSTHKPGLEPHQKKSLPPQSN